LADIEEIIDIECFGDLSGQATVDVRSGNAPYSFMWSDGSLANPLNDVGAGEYEVTITDALDCQITRTANIEQPELKLNTTLVQEQPISCYERSDGSIEVAATGGTPPYRYQWANGDTLRTRTGLAAGSYTLSVVDENNCSLETAIELRQPDPLQITFDAEEICYEEVGSFIVNVAGGTPPYQISRDTSFEELTNFYDNLPAGRYTVFVQDQNGCLENATIDLVQRPNWDFFFPRDTFQIVKGDSVRTEAYLSIADIELRWFPDERRSTIGQRIAWLRPLTTTDYNVIASDEFGCIKSASLTVLVKDTSAVYIPNAFTPANNYGSGNGVNDHFTAYSNFPAVVQIQQLIISDQWGTTLFEARDIPLNIEEAGWNGRFGDEPMPPGEYAYSITIEYIDEIKTFSGVVNLIR
jgi:gliding motility-associated-like protein